jgi:hypothetical protein
MRQDDHHHALVFQVVEAVRHEGEVGGGQNREALGNLRLAQIKLDSPYVDRISPQTWKHPLPPLRLRASAAEFFTYLVSPFGLKCRSRREEAHFSNFRTGPRSQSIWSILQSIWSLVTSAPTME